MTPMRCACRLLIVLATVALLQLGIVRARAASATGPVLDTAGLFEEPLVPASAAPSGDDAALAGALAAYQIRHAPDDVAAIEAFLAAHKQSRWRLALLTNLGLTYYRYGYFSKAIDAFQQAWDFGRSATEPRARRLADRALGELLEMHARLGHADRLAALLPQADARGLTGGATELRDGAKEGLWTMRHDPGVAYLCGPTALKNLLLAQGASAQKVAFLDGYRSGPHGVTLAQVGRLADQAGLAHVLVHRTPGQPVPVPSIIHWNVDHFAAIVGEARGRFRLVDPTFGDVLWVTRGAIDSEGSGDFLVPGPVAPPGFRRLSAAEAQDIFGMGITGKNDGNALTPTDVSAQGTTNNCPLCAYSFKEMLVSLTLSDTPVGYVPPIGPAVRTVVTYNQREMGQPANFSFYNVSPKWTLNWSSYVEDDPTMPGANVVRHVGGGGEVPEVGYEAATGAFTPESYDASVLTLTGPDSYTRTLPDGSIETYGVSNGATAAPRLIFLSKVTDPQGNAIALGYDTSLRLKTITDATGLVTQFAYTDTSFPLQVTQITDPFGRFATLTYNTAGQLAMITDVLGLQSQFQYDTSGLVNQLTTPYGKTMFTYGDDGNTRYLGATDPLGHTEYLKYQQQVPGVPPSDPHYLVPKGILDPANDSLEDRDTFYWDKHAYTLSNAATDVDVARIRHWAHLASNLNFTSDFLESEKPALEHRIWFNYPGQPMELHGARISGTLNKPSRIGRVLENGDTQLTEIAYNTAGNPARLVDPAGRTTIVNYYPNQIDVLSVQQVTASGPVTIASYGHYSAGHRPSSFTDAAGQTTRYDYNQVGQLVRVTDPLQEVTKFDYYPSHRLQDIVNADNKTALSLEYDDAGRAKFSTDSEGYTLEYAYDNADRLRQITYPDGTTRKLGYTTLDLTSFIDRQQRLTRYVYNADRYLTAVFDPLKHETQFTPYENGVLHVLTDANGNATTFGIDAESRVTGKAYADGTVWKYVYDPATSRLYIVTDPLAQVRTYLYGVDDRLARITYSNTVNPTPTVGFGYDPYFPRRSAMSDGDGTTRYAYYPPGHLGALQLSGEAPPFGAGSAIAYGYDRLGRLASRSVGGDAETFGYDALGRLVSHSGDLGKFTLGYLGETGQLTSRGNGTVATAWTYDTNLHDRKLIAVASTPGGSQYQFPDNAPEGDIQSIVDSYDNQTWTLGYDAADHLRTASSTLGPADAYAPDAAGNLIHVSRPTQRLAIPPNALNQAASVDGTAYVYDADGELVQDATRKYAWDAEGRLVGIGDLADGSVVTSLRYDGLGRRVSIGTTSGGTTAETQYGWCGSTLCQARTGAAAPLRRYLAEGEATPSENSYDYYAPDQLGSVRDVLDATSGARVAHYDYEWFGVRLGRATASATDFRYAGLFLEPTSGLFLSATRAYDPNVGRWLSRDPIGEAGGVNLYAYVGGEPVSLTDRGGQAPGDPFPSADKAGLDALRTVNPQSIAGNVEYGGRVYQSSNGNYYATQPTIGDNGSVDLSRVVVPSGAQVVGDYHTHGDYTFWDFETGSYMRVPSASMDNLNSDTFSSWDIEAYSEDSETYNYPDYSGYLGTPSGQAYKYSVLTGNITLLGQCGR